MAVTHGVLADYSTLHGQVSNIKHMHFLEPPLGTWDSFPILSTASQLPLIFVTGAQRDLSLCVFVQQGTHAVGYAM